MANFGCVYCDHFPTLKIVKKRKDKPDIRRCHVAKRKVTSERARECVYFKPTTHPFYCDNNHCRLDLINCIARRRNRLGLKAWENCKQCRQWDQDLRQVVDKYIMDMAPVVEPPPEKPKRKIKRRKKRTIKRREKRTIKRREVKPKRKIKRRS